ncbi:NAD(P)/FAD-dependent oxidoreductase [Sphingomonas solaris]|uniref:Monooxygenase n=1 Tax=Alterirhizorhabdus solaris TaxID=2529389 RepID=A0A558R7N5_9SPHN|nr:FAD-dependent monooxygenase [Sphingomonas solaris]TVV75394.1 monooxygenase [Sphingomonas solaris]
MSRPLIIGGGPAGSAAAIGLARAGTPALLIERSRDPHDVVCGGFLGWDALAALKRLGLDPAALGARPITRLRVVAGSRVTEAALPRVAAGLSRITLDAALLAQAQAAGTAVERGVTVREASPGTLRTGDGATLTAEALFLATGKHELRGLSRPREAAGDDPAVGLRARLVPSPRLATDLAGMIELHLYDRGYAGLLVQEDGSINLCLSVKRSRLGAGPAALLDDLARDAPRLVDRIAAARDKPEWQAIAGVPYGWRARETVAGLFRLGDQAAVIASLAGDGVAIALASGMAAAARFTAEGPAGAPAYQRAFARQSASPLRVAGTIRAVGEGPFGTLLPLLARLPGLAALTASLTRIERGAGG